MGKEAVLIELTLFVAIICGCLLQRSVVSGCTEKDRLVRDLTQGYLTAVEPDNSVLRVGLAFTCSRYDEDTRELTSSVWEKLTWTDRRLKWTPKEFGGIESIRLPAKFIWTPDMKLYNSLVPIEERDLTNVVVSHDGTVIWVPPSLYRTHCSADETGSGLSCPFKLGSWTYDADTLKLELDEPSVDAGSYLNSTCPLAFEGGTAVVKTNYYPCCKEPYSHAEFSVSFRKQKV